MLNVLPFSIPSIPGYIKIVNNGHLTAAEGQNYCYNIGNSTGGGGAWGR